jgi:plasmid replication initiation protein
MNNLVLINENNEIKKSEALVRSRYKLNPLALKLITTLISSIQSNDKIDQVYQVAVKQFTDLANLKGNDYYTKLDEATTEILSKPLHIPKDDGKSFLKANWCSSIEYRDGEGIIEFQISPKIFPYILNLKNNYLKYNLCNILPLRSDYSIRLYEFLKDEYNKNGRYGRNAVAVFELDFLRDRFQIPDSYKFKDIRVQILNKAQEDLLKHTDIKFEWEVASKIRKRVHSLKFKIYPNLKNAEENIKLPTYLDNFMNYVNYLRDQYKATSKSFLLSNYTINDKKDLYNFGINDKSLMFATPFSGGDSIPLSKEQSEVIYNASYLCSLYSEIYRDLIQTNMDFWDLAREEEFKELFGIIKNEIKQVLKTHDPRIRPMF